MYTVKMEAIANPTKAVKLALGIAKSAAESMQILDIWFNILTAKKAASANRFKRSHYV